MSDQTGCTFCKSSDLTREKDGKIRCIAFSEWREPLDDICEYFFDRKSWETLNEIKKLKEG